MTRNARDFSFATIRHKLLALLTFQALILTFVAYWQSPCSDEFGHAYAGLQFWDNNNLELFNVNPPLVRAIAALPLYLEPLEFFPEQTSNHKLSRPEFPLGRELYSLNGSPFRSRLFAGRLLVASFAMLGTLACYLLGKHLGNESTGLVAAAFWVFQPQIISHGALITNDVPVAATMALFVWCFLRWRDSDKWLWAVASACSLGLACSCKFTALILWPIVVGFCLIDLVGRQTMRTQRIRALLQILSFCVLTIFIIGIPYRFASVAKPLEEYSFESKALSGSDFAGNRFAGTWLGRLPVPLPAQYLLGLDRQQFDFESGLVSYAHGEKSDHGWWWFYLYSMLVKLPAGTLLGICAGFAYWLRISDRPIGSRADLWVVALALVNVTAWKSGFAQQHRYIFPLYPILFALISMPMLEETCRTWRTVTLISLGLTVLGMASASPNWLASFNFLAGGTDGGHHHLFNDATDWGQDADRVVAWVQDHPEHRPLYLCSANSFQFISEKTLGLPPDVLYQPTMHGAHGLRNQSAGWWVVSKTDLVMFDELRIRFSNRVPNGQIGGTHFIYRVVRSENALLGTPD
ncbi:glycosyltransferase family 39 protein [Rubripirellula amarantea]|nr:glycosyltransferase family 39 protein [Rubripirellula amarantea]